MLGQWPAISNLQSATFSFPDDGKLSLHFPFNMSKNFLYPEVSSGYTMPDGTSRDVPCFIPGETNEVPRAECPTPFVSPIAKDHVESCIQPCPVDAYTDDEYTLMWGLSNTIGLFGLALNCFIGECLVFILLSFLCLTT